MKRLQPVTRSLILGIITALGCFALSSCDFEVPITSKPTRNIDQHLLGDWVHSDGKEKMKVVKYDDSIYIVEYDGDLYKVFHSDLGKNAFLSVQDIGSEGRKWAYMIYTISPDGKWLSLRAVDNKVIPKDTKDSASMQRLLETNLKNPELFGEEQRYTQQK